MPKRIRVIFLTIALLCTGCASKNQSAGWPVVSELRVTVEQNGLLLQQTCIEPELMRQTLNLLRNLGQKFTPSVDPDTLNTPYSSILVGFTDGSSRIYRIRSDRYIRIDSGPWLQADPKKIERLQQYLQTLCGNFHPV